MKTIILKMGGGLGNQIFQFIAGQYLKVGNPEINLKYDNSSFVICNYRKIEINKLLKEPIFFPEKLYERNIISKIIVKIFSKIIFLNRKLNICILLNFLDEVNENDLKTIYPDRVPLKSLLLIINRIKDKERKKPLFACGYWQNPSLYANELSNFTKYFKDTSIYLPPDIIPNSYISIHVRRGDYIQNEEIYSEYNSKFSPIQFIKTALNILPPELKKLPIYLISDDLNWARNLIESVFLCKQTIIVINNKDPIYDWVILRHSRLNICSNSTFSYTAALLNKENEGNKLRAIIPQWYSKNVSSLHKGWLSPDGFLEI
tara:strand:+ start:5533 stop:6483 length:951 start_codon:yes stop_codon:yes gene_type:complete